MNIEG
jgi:hypothetical protein